MPTTKINRRSLIRSWSERRKLRNHYHCVTTISLGRKKKTYPQLPRRWRRWRVCRSGRRCTRGGIHSRVWGRTPSCPPRGSCTPPCSGHRSSPRGRLWSWKHLIVSLHDYVGSFLPDCATQRRLMCLSVYVCWVFLRGVVDQMPYQILMTLTSMDSSSLCDCRLSNFTISTNSHQYGDCLSIWWSLVKIKTYIEWKKRINER